VDTELVVMEQIAMAQVMVAMEEGLVDMVVATEEDTVVATEEECTEEWE
jgi:hypothetical protein